MGKYNGEVMEYCNGDLKGEGIRGLRVYED